jgi:hypothetical protein
MMIIIIVVKSGIIHFMDLVSRFVKNEN